LAALLTTLTSIATEAPATPERSRKALGFQADLFPTVVSAVNRKLGYAPQVWFGIDPLRLRLVVAHFEPPDALAFADDGAENPKTTALAAVVDYTFGEHFDGVWVGAGFDPESVSLAGATYDPTPIVASASLKVGWFADL
jgi:hypothetical protein